MEKIKILFILLIYITICIIIYNKIPIKENTKTIENILNEKNSIPLIEEKPIGEILIKKINLKQPIYNQTSKKNNIEENVTILNGSESPSQENSIMFLAAHSGQGNIAFFNNLDKLNINDIILLKYDNITYKYIVTNIWETKKDGNIEIIKENYQQLILTTCSKQNKKKQLIINCKKIEST